MAYYSDEIIEEVRSRNDIVDVISGYVSLKKRGSTYVGLCPFHNEKTGSFSVHPGMQIFHCFGCGAAGNVITFVMKYENFTFGEAMQNLAERAGVELPKQEMTAQQKQQADKRTKILEVNKIAAKYFYSLMQSPAGERANKYFEQRGLTKSTIQRFGLGYANKYSNDLYQFLKKKGYSDELLKDSGLCSIDERRGGYDKFWNRAMFPIMDINNRVIGFGGRVMGEGEPKYLNSPETLVFDKSRTLYGLNYARLSRRPNMLLCEGYMDVISLHQAGFDNAVAALGTAFTSGHASLLKRYAKEVYLTFDSDGAGIKAALRAIPILKEAGLNAKVINMKPYKDPDEFIKALGAEAYQERIDNAENSFMFEIRIMEQDYDLKDPTSKTEFFHAVAKKILGFPEELERENYIEAVADKYNIGFEQLRSMVRGEGTRGGIVTERKPLKTGINENKKKDSGTNLSQKYLLRWLAEGTEYADVIRKYISPEDFSNELYRQVAEVLYKQLDEGKANPAQIINMYQDETEQDLVAQIFGADIEQLDSSTDRRKAVNETILKVKKDGIDYQSKHLDPTDINGIQRIVAQKQLLMKLQKELR